VRRRVALKVIKLGMDTRTSSPGSSRTAGTRADGSPEHREGARCGRHRDRPAYFVMELVRGIKVTDYCDQNNLPTRLGLSCSSKSAGPFSMHTRRGSSTGISASNILGDAPHSLIGSPTKTAAPTNGLHTTFEQIPFLAHGLL